MHRINEVFICITFYRPILTILYQKSIDTLYKSKSKTIYAKIPEFGGIKLISVVKNLKHS